MQRGRGIKNFITTSIAMVMLGGAVEEGTEDLPLGLHPFSHV